MNRSLPIAPLARARAAAFAVVVFSLSAVPAFAGGMALTMQNGAQLGSAFSGAASAEDASTIYFNPAGMAWLSHTEVIAGGCYFFSSGGFTNNGSSTGGVMPTSGGDGGTALGSTLVPSLFVAHPFSDKLAFGLGISSPFGLRTGYDSGWVGRYHAIDSELDTININPAFSWRPSDSLAFGFGLNWQSVDAELSNAVDFGLIGFSNGIPGFAPGSADGLARVSGDDSTTGFNAGMIFEPSDGTRIGFHFRSKMRHRLSGNADFSGVPAPFAAMFPNQSAEASLTLPEIVSISFHRDLSPAIAISADWSWWNWSRFSSLVVDMENPATPDSTLVQNWNDASIISAGVRWKRSETFALRGGVAWNESPVNDALRSPRIPDSDRLWVTLGASWILGDQLQAHVGYAHLFVEDSTSAIDDGAGHVLAGDYSVSVNILSAQVNWQF